MQSSDTEDTIIYEVMDPTVVPGELSLEEFVKNFSHALPQQIEVSKGVYGTDNDSTLSTSDLIDVHCFIKREMVRIEEKKSKQTYSVPFNSSIKFAPIFNPHDSVEQMNKGERFPYVANILDLVIKPKVVCALQPIDTNAELDSTDYKEVLAIKETIHAESRAQGRKLRVYSFTDCCDKVLDESVYGDFSTRPADTKLYMQDILKHVTGALPMHLLMLKDSKVPKMMGIPYCLYQNPLIVTKKFTEGILIVSNARSAKKFSDPYEIPIDVDIDIQLVNLPEKEHEALVKGSEELKEKLSSLSTRIYKYENMNDEMLRAQTKLYELVRNASDPTSPRKRKPSPGPSRSLIQRIDKLEKAAKEEKERLTARFASQEKLINMQAQQLNMAARQLTSLRKQLRELTKMVHGDNVIMEEDTDDDFQLSDPRPEDAQEDSKISVATEGKNNRRKLSQMNTQQLVEFLRANGLDKYEATFLKAGITGEMLLECDEQVLENELDIKSKLHRKRLMMIISEGEKDV